MAKETRFIEVEPSSTEATIELWQKFGWELMGAPQEVLSETSGTSHLERRGDSIYSVTTAGTKTHYVKITFQRDKNMENYNELVKLEEAYHSKSYASSIPSQPYKPNSLSLWFAIVPFIVGVLCMCGDDGTKTVGGVFLVVGVALGIFCARDAAKKTSAFAPVYSEWEATRDKIKGENKKKRREILMKAESLLK